MSNERIRGYRPEDLAAVYQLIHETIDVCYAGIYPPHAIVHFKQFHSVEGIAARAQKGTLLVVEKGGSVIATGACVHGEIYGVFVDPKAQRSGCGRALMRELEKAANSEGYTEIGLDISLPSRGFYEGLGYVVLEECAIDVGEGEPLRYWKAKKALREQ